MAEATIPLGGNAFITKRGSGDLSTTITEIGLESWRTAETSCSIFFRLSQAEVYKVSLRLRVAEGVSKIRLSIGNTQSYEVEVTGSEFYIEPIGTFFANSSGYVQLELEGIEKTGATFADISHLILSNIVGEVQHVAEITDFYFGRRGPSVHLRFKDPSSAPMVYFYSEITVPFGQDVHGAYFMATGFAGGYFGIQVNSEAGAQQERRVLFSIWSDYDTDDPEDIPEEFRVVLLKKGTDVVVQDFGDEGSGKQSYLPYAWKPDETYKFLVFASPIDADNTRFTGWFWTPSAGTWQLMASFQKPKVSIHLQGLYSFSENFVPENGYIERRALFGNQWVYDLEGIWHEITTCQFTGDATSKKNRGDYAGGSFGNTFFLRNCGFFSDNVETGQEFARLSGNTAPEIDFPNLP